MATNTVKILTFRPIDSRDRLPAPNADVMVWVKTKVGHIWKEAKGSDISALHRFSSGPVYWSTISTQS